MLNKQFYEWENIWTKYWTFRQTMFDYSKGIALGWHLN